MILKFDISDDDIITLQNLIKEAGLETPRELFNHSLTLLEWAIEQTKDGKVIAAIDESKPSYSAIDMDMLQYVAENNSRKDLNNDKNTQVKHPSA